MDKASVSESAQPRAGMFSMYPNESGCILPCSTACLRDALLALKDLGLGIRVINVPLILVLLR